jgi:hypothetical protein
MDSLTHVERFWLQPPDPSSPGSKYINHYSIITAYVYILTSSLLYILMLTLVQISTTVHQTF